MTRIFLSCASGEYKPIRVMLADDLRSDAYEVRSQEDLAALGGKLLSLIDDQVRECSGVVHLVGVSSGETPKPKEVEQLQRSYRDFGGVTGLSEQQIQRLTYTQWEAWLAIYHKIPCFVFVEEVALEATLIEPQSSHWSALREHGHHWIPFSDREDLRTKAITKLHRFFERTIRQSSESRIENLPYPSIDTLLKGRQADLGQLQDRLAPQHSRTVSLSSIHGLGGIGKTRLAVEYAWRNAQRYRALLFVTADTPQDFTQNLSELVSPDVLDLPDAFASVDQKKRLAAVLKWLRENERWLLIIDNVDTESAAQLVEKTIGSLCNGHVLITSRIATWSPAVQTVELSVLDESAGTDFLLARTRQRIRKGDDEEIARRLAGDLGGHALALEQAGAYIDEMQISLARYRELWSDGHDDVQNWQDERVTNYPRSLSACLRLNLMHVEQNHPPARQLIEHLSWFDAEPIPSGVFDNSRQEAVWTEVLSDKRLFKALGSLRRYSLIGRDRNGAVTMHRLVRQFAQEQQSDSTSQIRGTLKVLHRAVASAELESSEEMGDLIPHVDATLEYEDKMPLEPAVAADMLQIAGNWLVFNANEYRRAAAMLVAFQRLSADPMVDDQMRCRGLPALASVYWYDADYDLALRIAQQARKISKKTDIDPRVCIRIADILGCLYTDLGYFRASEYVFDEGLALCDQHLSPTDPIRGFLLNEKAWLYREMGRYQEAAAMFQERLQADEMMQQESQAFGITHNNLAYVYESWGCLDLAKEHNDIALRVISATIGEANKYFAHALNVCGDIQRKSGQLPAAIDSLERSLEIQMTEIADVHPHTAMVHWSLAETHLARADLRQAELHAKNALRIRERILPVPHPQIASCLEQLARVEHTFDRSAESERLSKLAQEMRQKHRHLEKTRPTQRRKVKPVH
ncbi:DUF7779 domain-containing protein [Stieleria varia]|uniref:NB-ARC domain protein n=1 Tax=Stieleria varia TaxID=2528005 RepID=A0A5C6B823_9BACT|nr:tetratricopeptide repeat protein [Stieleria varia]TWU08223.1 NB-ARC domain protein [Stieleria varia]